MSEIETGAPVSNLNVFGTCLLPLIGISLCRRSMMFVVWWCNLLSNKRFVSSSDMNFSPHFPLQ